MEFEGLHRTVALLAIEQKLNQNGRVSCATFLRTGTCDRGVACKQAHYPPFRMGRIEGSEASVLGDYIIFLSNISKNPQFRIKKVPTPSLRAAFSEALDCINTYTEHSSWRRDSYGDVYLLIHDSIFNFSVVISKFEKELSNKEKKSNLSSEALASLKLFRDTLAAIRTLSTGWLDEEKENMKMVCDCALTDPNSSGNKSLSGIVESQANELFRELSSTSSERREIIEFLSAEFKKCSVGGAESKLTLLPFGSTCSGFGYGVSDLDLVLLVGDEYHEIVQNYSSIVEYHRRPRSDVASVSAVTVLQCCMDAAVASGQFSVSALVESARVPVLKLRHIVHDLEVDICVNNAFPLYNTQLLRQYALTDRRVRYLAFAVKLWTKRRGVSDPHNSSYSSYTWVLLVVYFLLQHRRGSSGPMLTLIPAAGIAADLIESPLAQIFESLVIDDCSPTCDDLGNVASLLAEFFAFYATEANKGFRGSRNTLVFDRPSYDAGGFREAPVKACVRTGKRQPGSRSRGRGKGEAEGATQESVVTLAGGMGALNLDDKGSESDGDSSENDASDASDVEKESAQGAADAAAAVASGPDRCGGPAGSARPVTGCLQPKWSAKHAQRASSRLRDSSGKR